MLWLVMIILIIIFSNSRMGRAISLGCMIFIICKTPKNGWIHRVTNSNNTHNWYRASSIIFRNSIRIQKECPITPNWTKQSIPNPTLCSSSSAHILATTRQELDLCTILVSRMWWVWISQVVPNTSTEHTQSKKTSLKLINNSSKINSNRIWPT